MLNTPLINILVRTHRRPQGFARTIQELRNQTYKNIRIIVSCDDEFSYDYIKENNIPDEDIVFIKDDRRSLGSAFYNSYIKDLLNAVEDGYVIVLDDDDYITSDIVLEKIARHLKDKNTLYLFKMDFLGTILPQKYWGIKPALYDTGGSSFAAHYTLAKKREWKPIQGGDGIYLEELFKDAENTVWLDYTFTIVRQPNHGKSEV